MDGGNSSSSSTGNSTGDTDWDDRADILFATKHVDDIKAWEEKTRGEITSKRRELRHLVGGKYRDFINAADQIVHMSKLTDTVHSSLGAIRKHWLSASDFREHLDNGLERQVGSVNQYRIAIQMKILMDAPEKVWSSLEHDHLMHAAMCLRLAEHVYEHFREVSSSTLATSFSYKAISVVDAHWTAMTRFSENIQSSCSQTMADKDNSVLHLAEALAATQILSQQSVEKLLQHFLDVRLLALRKDHCSQSCTVQVKEPTAALIYVAQKLVMTLVNVLSLFCSFQEMKTNESIMSTSNPFLDILDAWTSDSNSSERQSWLQETFLIDSPLASFAPEHVVNFRPNLP
eukprot:gene8725-1109_t